MLTVNDTIVALATPPGRSAIGVIRLSGPRSLAITRALVSDDSFSPEPNDVSLHSLYDLGSSEPIDQALITYFRAPRSFTGEDVIEISCHGSPVLLRLILDNILRLNARTSDPGEFSLRALAHGRMNLTQAEAIRDLIDAQTSAAVRQANKQLRGEISHMLQPVKDLLLEIVVKLESSMEFVEDDLPPVEHEEVAGKLRDLRERLAQLADTFQQGRFLSAGVKVALVGRPNVGKSSVFNRLLAQDRAIVTDVPGTTRDTLTEIVDVKGVPVLLTDTAGVRNATDRIETIGVERARRAVADADIAIVVIDGAEDLVDEDFALLDDLRDQPCVVALNKSDLPTFDHQRLREQLTEIINGTPLIIMSAKTNEGVEELRDALLNPLTRDQHGMPEGLLITNARHYDLLTRAVQAISSSEQLFGDRVSEDLVLVGLHDALRYLGELLGETTTDDILGQIFATFCIGK